MRNPIYNALASVLYYINQQNNFSDMKFNLFGKSLKDNQFWIGSSTTSIKPCFKIFYDTTGSEIPLCHTITLVYESDKSDYKKFLQSISDLIVLFFGSNRIDLIDFTLTEQKIISKDGISIIFTGGNANEEDYIYEMSLLMSISKF